VAGTWSAHAAIAAAAYLRGTRPEYLAHALAIATLCGPVLKGTGDSHFAMPSDSDVKEGIPWGTMTGMMSLYLADAGHTGPLEILDTPTHFDGARILDDLGGPPLIRRTYFKPYACCRHLHAPLDAFCELIQKHSIAVADIVAVEVHTYAATFSLSNVSEPDTLINVQYSVPFCIGICALRGKAGLRPVETDVLADPEIRAFAKRVTLHEEPAFTARFPAETPTRVVIRTSRASFESPVTLPLGDPTQPLCWADLETKFRVATRKVFSSERQDALLHAIECLRRGDFQPLQARLGEAPEKNVVPSVRAHGAGDSFASLPSRKLPMTK
jgi:2-methylcitrate dehydratase PrpD